MSVYLLDHNNPRVKIAILSIPGWTTRAYFQQYHFSFTSFLTQQQLLDSIQKVDRKNLNTVIFLFIISSVVVFAKLEVDSSRIFYLCTEIPNLSTLFFSKKLVII